MRFKAMSDGQIETLRDRLVRRDGARSATRLPVGALVLLLSLLASTTVSAAQTSDTQGSEDQDRASVVTTPDDFEALIVEMTGFTFEEMLSPWHGMREALQFKELNDRRLARIARRDIGQMSYWEYGVPLRESEYEEMRARDVHVEEMGVVLERAATHDSYSGVEVDYSRNGKERHTLRFTTRIRRADRQALNDLVSDKSRLKLRFDGKRKRRDLENLRDEIALSDEYEGHEVVATVIDPDSEQVVVTVDADDGDALPSVSTDEIVVLEVGEPEQTTACPSRRSCDGRFRAGVLSHNIARGTRGECSSSFTVRRISDSRYFQLGAAHCGQVDSQIEIQGQRPLNRLDFEFEQVDVSLIRIDRDEASNLLFKSAGNTLHRVRRLSVVPRSGSVCVHGIVLGRSCGTLSGNGEIVNYRTKRDSFSNGDVEESKWRIGFAIAIRVPGTSWSCDGAVGRSPGGISGGAVTNGWGSTAYGVLSTCSFVSFPNNTNNSHTILNMKAAPVWAFAKNPGDSSPGFLYELVTATPN